MDEHDCDKYCWASCDEHHDNGGDEFSVSDCLLANDHCKTCFIKINRRNPFLYFLLFVAAITLIIGLCYRSVSRGKRHTAHVIVAQHVTSNTTGGAVYVIPSHGLGSSAITPGQARPFIIPTEQERPPQGQQSKVKDELPSEYLPPPEYNTTCVPNVNEMGPPYTKKK